MPPLKPVLSSEYADLLKPGHVVEVDHKAADELGAFEEDALSLEDVIASSIDLEADDGQR